MERPVFNLLGLGADLLLDMGVDSFSHVLFELLQGQLLLGLGLFDSASESSLGHTSFVAWKWKTSFLKKTRSNVLIIFIPGMLN